MQEIKFKADENLYKDIVNEAKKRGLTIDSLITKIVTEVINSEKENLSEEENRTILFKKELENSFKDNKAIYKGLADK